MTDAIEKIKRMCEFKPFKYRPDVATVALLGEQAGMKLENKRLSPIILTLLEIIEIYRSRAGILPDPAEAKLEELCKRGEE